MSDEITGTLEPGRALDALIAEHVMGARWYHFRNGLEPSGWTRFLSDRRDDEQYEEARGDEALGSPNVREYSSNMFHAWLVVERLHKEGWYARLTYTFERYRCEFSRGDERLGAHAAIEPKVCRMPLAVCRAAMLVVDARAAVRP